MSYDDGETPITRLGWIDEWLARGDAESAAKCARERYYELLHQPPEVLACIPQDKWNQLLGMCSAWSAL